MGVSKGHTVQAIQNYCDAGLFNYGENRIDEAESKFSLLKEDYSKIHLHMIGPIQTNKAAHVVRLCDTIHTLDRPKLAVSLVKEMEKMGKQLPCYIQINIGEEPQKSGVLPAHADTFIQECQKIYQLPIVGVMCIPPLNEASAPYFALTRQIALRNGLNQLSMGMSHDYSEAVRYGATIVRVGTALFGKREST